MTSTTVAITCPVCDGDLKVIAEGKPTSYETRCVLGCLACHKHWLFTLSLQPIAKTQGERQRSRLERLQVTP